MNAAILLSRRRPPPRRRPRPLRRRRGGGHGRRRHDVPSPGGLPAGAACTPRAWSPPLSPRRPALRRRYGRRPLGWTAGRRGRRPDAVPRPAGGVAGAGQAAAAGGAPPVAVPGARRAGGGPYRARISRSRSARRRTRRARAPEDAALAAAYHASAARPPRRSGCWASTRSPSTGLLADLAPELDDGTAAQRDRRRPLGRRPWADLPAARRPRACDLLAERHALRSRSDLFVS